MYECFHCHKEKVITEFHKDNSRLRGFKETCKSCLSLIRKSKPKKEYSIANITHLICETCKENKTIHNYGVNKRRLTGLNGVCKSCRKIKSKNRYERHKDKIKENSLNYYKENKLKINEKRCLYQKQRLKKDKLFNLSRNLRNRLYYALKNKNWKKNSEFNKYIGCTREELIKHIEFQFEEGMTWDNLGEWEIDHQKPLSKAINQKDLYKRCHYSNLRPLWKLDNIKKSNKDYTCWQKIKRDQFLKEDSLVYPLDLKVQDFEFSHEKFKQEHKNFIVRYEWLGNVGFNVKWVFTARWRGHLAGVMLLAEARKAQFGPKEVVIQRGACSSWAPNHLNSSLVMFTCRWMVRNTEKRYFVAYIDQEAGEYGTIYQACNFDFLGYDFGSKTYYQLPNKEVWDRSSFFRERYMKERAKFLGIEWKEPMNKEQLIFIKNDIKNLLKTLPKINKPKKGKYILLLNYGKIKYNKTWVAKPYPKRKTI